MPLYWHQNLPRGGIWYYCIHSHTNKVTQRAVWGQQQIYLKCLKTTLFMDQSFIWGVIPFKINLIHILTSSDKNKFNGSLITSCHSGNFIKFIGQTYWIIAKFTKKTIKFWFWNIKVWEMVWQEATTCVNLAIKGSKYSTPSIDSL